MRALVLACLVVLAVEGMQDKRVLSDAAHIRDRVAVPVQPLCARKSARNSYASARNSLNTD
jgi:hypothetical protein